MHHPEVHVSEDRVHGLLLSRRDERGYFRLAALAVKAERAAGQFFQLIAQRARRHHRRGLHMRYRRLCRRVPAVLRDVRLKLRDEFLCRRHTSPHGHNKPGTAQERYRVMCEVWPI